jgi:hypothetical protein
MKDAVVFLVMLTAALALWIASGLLLVAVLNGLRELAQ